MTVPVAKPIAVWLFICAGMVVAMMIIGAITRLRDLNAESFLISTICILQFNTSVFWKKYIMCILEKFEF